tara:strand:- start:322 stop:1971 length:1650 start_codon:yes stop_codon:yes gene_type:complete
MDISGNFIVGGTVDGRNVANDGTKLDGIETGATADQTKADIDALNINANTLDGRQGYQYVFDGLDNGATDIMVNDADFIVRDTTDSITNFLWRDHSASKLYIGTADAQPTTRYDLYTQGGSRYWHAGNDGSGSGLDADLLDGQHGSYYYSPANPPAAGAAESFVTYSSAPSSSSAGDVYFNTTESKAYISNGTVWAPFTNAAPEPTGGTRSLSGTNGSSFSHNLDTDFTDDQPITNASYTHNSGSLPPGISISGNLLSGTPTSTGTYTFGISGRDVLGAEGTDKSYSFVVNATPFSATGGSVSYSGGYTYHTFTSSGNFTVSGQVSKSVDYLIVAGGGGGGSDRYQDRSSGGGGAGGMLNGTRSTGAGTYSAVIGGGGSGDVSGTAGGDGSNSSLSSFGSTAIGGGGGAGHTNASNYAGRSGGSGGGGTHDNSAGPPGSGTSGQGFAGAYSNNSRGGSGAQWVNGTYYAGGGAGSSSSSYTGGGGGGKAGTPSGNSSSGGVGGGGNSGISTGTVTGTAGSANTGGGGGAARETTAGGGGSGVVIVRYQT